MRRHTYKDAAEHEKFRSASAGARAMYLVQKMSQCLENGHLIVAL